MKFAYKSIKGKRSENQDKIALFEKDNVIFAIVCDGIGGHHGGSLASSTTINNFGSDFIEKFDAKTTDIETFFKLSFYNNIDKFGELASKDSKLIKMGTTLTSVFIDKNTNQITCFNVGDSRTYVLNTKNKLVQISEDNNLYNEIDPNKRHLYSPNELKELTNYIGLNSKKMYDVYKIDSQSFQNIKVILLCSDGVYGFLSDETLKNLISEEISLNLKVDKIINSALINGSNDNISLIAIDVRGENEHI
ncbi:protein phosphatase 2C domain-containing protein [Mycoplasmopsis ciconiae]|uniref:Protein phosphatase 2C domain-containing protein n=1 Tax=Mycoplasmopsis ciconiae TaxID=561067 RepID=A0ABU7MM10_9BACT|nr:protein phosphatase 2C domain-containing protein [Mycoplasmopsis ciconiae]